MASLPAPAGYKCHYNGIDFPVESKISPDLTFVPDASKRTIAQTTVLLTVRARIAAGATQDASLDAIRAALERPGGALILTGFGFGTLDINSTNPGTRRDLAFGPTPHTLSFNNVGAGRAADIVWKVEVAVLGCLSSADSFQVMEFTTSPTMATDRGGYLTRTITGNLRIPMTRSAVGNPTLPDNADRLFEAYLPAASPGFARTITHTLSRDRASFDFTVTDQELPGNPLPEGIVAATASQTHTCGQKGALVQWTVSLNASYEVARDKPRSLAWEAFIRLLSDRARKLRDAGWHLFVPMSMSIGEPEIYGPQAGSFSISYLTIKDGIAHDAVRIFTFPLAGLWTSTGDDWNRHAASLAAGAQHPRGLLQARVEADSIVDLCLAQPSGSGTLATPPRGSDQPSDEEWTQIRTAMGVPDNPNPASTWIGYDSRVVVEETNRLHTHFPLPTGPDPNAGNSSLHTPGFGGNSSLHTPGFGGNAAPGEFPQAADTFAFAPQDSPPPVRQYGGSPGYFVRLVGRAVRYAYEVPRPVLQSVRGVQLAEANDPKLGTFWESGIGRITVGPFYVARWNLRYFVPRQAGDPGSLVPVMPHPFQQEPAPVR